jgi:hypothetical protein
MMFIAISSMLNAKYVEINSYTKEITTKSSRSKRKEQTNKQIITTEVEQTRTEQINKRKFQAIGVS